jgi:beta-1,2-mannosidase
MAPFFFSFRSAATAGCRLVLCTAAVAEFQNIFRDWKRVTESPIFSPRSADLAEAGTFNSAVVIRNGNYVMLYRAQDAAGTSRLGYVESGDGIHFTRKFGPVLTPEAKYEKSSGVEDPRLVQLHGRYCLTYTGYNRKDAQLCLAESMD